MPTINETISLSETILNLKRGKIITDEEAIKAIKHIPIDLLTSMSVDEACRLAGMVVDILREQVMTKDEACKIIRQIPYIAKILE